MVPAEGRFLPLTPASNVTAVPLSTDEVSGRVLIVDDIPENLEFLSRVLTRRGYVVQTAISGEVALAMLRPYNPDLILLDICMPGLDGYQVCQELKADPETSNIPIIFLSALDEEEAKIRAFEVGGVDYITKPARTAEVLARVKTHLTLQRLQQQLRLQNQQLQQEIAARQQADDRYRSIYENSILGIFQISPDGRFLSANPALAQIYGYDSPEELIRSINHIGQQLYIRAGRWQELSAYVRHMNEVTDFESQVYQKDGQMIWISESVWTVRDQDGNLMFFEGTVEDITERKQTEAELRHQRQDAERLLLNIFPQMIAERLKRQRGTIAENYDNVTVLFADVVNFTALSGRISAKELVSLLNRIFSAFDQLAQRYGVEKIKTIGDGYMAAAGVPARRPNHPLAIAEMAIAMQETITQFLSDDGQPFQLRIGISTGPVVAGVIGTSRFSFDLWGETVNLASRMQTLGLPGEIQVTAATYEALKAEWDLEERGLIEVKGVGAMRTFLLKGKKPYRVEGATAAESLSPISPTSSQF